MESLEDFFENYADIVYAVDIDTNKIVYLNKAARKAFHFTKCQQYYHKKCYELLYHRDAPCVECTNKKLKENEFYDWSSINEDLNIFFAVHDTLIKREGHYYHFTIATDMSYENEQKHTLSKITNNEKITNEALEVAMAENDPVESINQMIKYLGSHMHCDRFYIFEQNEDNTFSNTFEWCADGVTEEKNNLQNLPEEIGMIWYDVFDRQKNIIIRDLEKYKEISLNMYEVLKPQHISTLVVAPLRLNGKNIGFYGVDNPPADDIDNIQILYSMLGKFISALLRHRDNVRKLERLSYYDALTGLNNRHSLNSFVEKINKQESVTYFFCDINGLKQINDNLGHDAGDRLLVKIATALKEFFAPHHVFRMGGDEFLAIICGVSEDDSIMMERDLRTYLKEHDMSCAVGRVWKKDNVLSFNKIFKEADAQMYADKRNYYSNHKNNRRRL